MDSGFYRLELSLIVQKRISQPSACSENGAGGGSAGAAYGFKDAASWGKQWLPEAYLDLKS